MRAPPETSLASLGTQRPGGRCGDRLGPPERRIMNTKARHWLDYDSVAFAVLVVGMGAIELLALSI
jgi:hypothetical protein